MSVQNANIQDSYGFVREPYATNTWYVYFNSTHAGTTQHMTSWTGFDFEMGAELENTGCYPGGYAATFDMQGCQMETDYNWYANPWSTFGNTTTACLTDSLHGFNIQDLGYGGWAWNLS